MFITKSGKECRNIQEQVEWNLEQIEKIKETLETIGTQYIEIKDLQQEGQGTLTVEQLEKIKNNDYVLVILQRDTDVYIKFDGGSYVEQDSLIKSLSAGGYARVFTVDLETGEWTLVESNESVTVLAQRVTTLETKNTIQDTAPTAAITDGGIHIVHLASSTGVTEYNGYIYMYDEA